MIPMVDLTAQYDDIRGEIEKGFSEVLDGAQFILGPNVQAFEQECAEYLGARHAVSCASGTDALHLALAAAGVGPGDEVITSPFTFIATAEAIRYVGATPVFVDIDPQSFNIDLELAARAITPRTRAIMPVHLFGQPVDAEACQALACEHNLLMIEDCAQSFGASWRGKQTGTFGIAGCFSFFPSKNLGGYGDGGLVCTESADIAEELRVLRNHGSRERYHHHVIGYNSRLDELQAVILRAKLKRIDRYNNERRRVARTYSEALAELPGITVPAETAGAHHVYHQYTLLLDGDRARVMEALKQAGSASAIYYPIPLHRQEVFLRDYAGVSLPVAESAAERCLSLPIYPELDPARQQTVIDALRTALN
ncbi:dTDP-4-amino-4,6-dideoxygalactose transaminase [Natronocella acetinitrilica]|uniref:dTDP-4-amino-4,6-dideoxygalactose transaminase n=1 Tax=Natronocella acetinitrilica TaxID=414046 RepID=A0AAE3KCW0_9GAMM|nr:DegT/DnrJ/EryC1/StrS family aminotransferase [Natronocella acetinitrilica]MCP1676161.1 dTDP-4-amino-4,6-dideoxygalactose transaminase [Natronocella acetinitrilica]